MTYHPRPRAAMTLACLLACLMAASSQAHSASVLASYYSYGSRTASGERFHPDGMTTAHRTLPFGTKLKVCRHSRCVIVRVTDRGPFIRRRTLDLSRGAARRLGMIGAGVARVTMERLR